MIHKTGNNSTLVYKYIMKKVKVKVIQLIKESKRFNRTLSDFCSHVFIIKYY